MIQVQTSKARPATPFVALPCAIGLTGRAAWSADRVKEAIGGAWITESRGAHIIYRAVGLGQTSFAAEDSLLIIANDPDLLQRMLGRQRGGTSPVLNATYAAYFRHDREQANFGRVMTAIDFSQPRTVSAPPFFSGNVASLSLALRRVRGVELIERATADRLEQRVVYRLTP
jgi:hypothetical protein